MVHSLMRSHLFEQTPPATLAISIFSTLPKMEGFNPLLSNLLHTLQKTTRGIPPPSHFGTLQIFHHRLNSLLGSPNSRLAQNLSHRASRPWIHRVNPQF